MERDAAPRAVVIAGRELAASLNASAATSWKLLTADGLRSTSAGSEYVANRPELVLPLLLSAVDLNLPTSTVVERAWLQTWISAAARQDRSAFRFRSIASQVAVELPPETQSMDIEVLLDGRPTPAKSRSAGRLVVDLAGSREQGAGSKEQSALNAASPSSMSLAETHTLELRYRQNVGEPLVARRRLTPPQMVAVTGVTEMYWQIVLSGDRHIVRSPALAPCNEWQWLGSFFGRRPTKSQSELEQWAGATAGLAPSAGQSEYLFSGFGPAASIELVTAPRWLIVLATSAIMLCLALVWLYVPVRGRGWVVAVSACLVAALAVAFPTPAALLGQASVLGVVLSALALWLSRLAASVPCSASNSPAEAADDNPRRVLRPRCLPWRLPRRRAHHRQQQFASGNWSDEATQRISDFGFRISDWGSPNRDCVFRVTRLGCSRRRERRRYCSADCLSPHFCADG